MRSSNRQLTIDIHEFTRDHLSYFSISTTYQLLNKKPTKLKISLALSSLLLSLPGASFAFYYTHLLPESAWYYQFRSILGTELLLIPMGIFGGCTASLLPRKILILPLPATAGFAITPFLKPLVAPLTLTPSEEWSDGVCLQSTSSTCGPASTATLLKQFNIHENEETLAKEC